MTSMCALSKYQRDYFLAGQMMRANRPTMGIMTCKIMHVFLFFSAVAVHDRFASSSILSPPCFRRLLLKKFPALSVVNLRSMHHQSSESRLLFGKIRTEEDNLTSLNLMECKRAHATSRVAGAREHQQPDASASACRRCVPPVSSAPTRPHLQAAAARVRLVADAATARAPLPMDACTIDQYPSHPGTAGSPDQCTTRRRPAAPLPAATNDGCSAGLI